MISIVTALAPTGSRRTNIPVPGAIGNELASASVLSAVTAGIGVALLSSISITDDVIEWPRAGELGDPPTVVNVARVSKGATSDVAAALVAELRAELGEVPANA